MSVEGPQAALGFPWLALRVARDLLLPLGLFLPGLYARVQRRQRRFGPSQLALRRQLQRLCDPLHVAPLRSGRFLLQGGRLRLFQQQHVRVLPRRHWLRLYGAGARLLRLLYAGPRRPQRGRVQPRLPLRVWQRLGPLQTQPWLFLRHGELLLHVRVRLRQLRQLARVQLRQLLQRHEPSLLLHGLYAPPLRGHGGLLLQRRPWLQLPLLRGL